MLPNFYKLNSIRLITIQVHTTWVIFSQNLWNDPIIIRETRPSAEEKEKQQKNTRGNTKDQPTGLTSKEKLKALLIEINLELKTHEPRWPD